MSTLLTAQFWLNPSPGLMTLAMERLLLAVIAVFILVSIACLILKNRKDFYKKLWIKLLTFFISNVIVGGALLFFNHEIIPFLSARAWYALWAIGMIVWAVFIILYAKKLPALKKQFALEKEFKKYIP